MAYQLTKKQMKDEIQKCGRDPIHFIKNYCRIQHPQRGLIPFHTYPFQDEVLQDFVDYKQNIVLKARQLGLSTVTAAYIVWLMLFRREKTVMVVATKFKTAANLVKKVKKMFKYVPPWMKIADIVKDNETEFTLSNGSQIMASSTSSDSGRSEALSLLVIDEAAFVDGLDDMWKAIGPTLARGGRCIALSTPNGVGNWFHKMYTQAVDMQNDFHPIRLHWSVHPEQDQEWYDKQKLKYSPRELAQEFECSFNMSGDTVIDPKVIQKLEKGCSEPLFRTGWDRNYWIWEPYIPGANYLITADVARGDGEDYSAFHVLKLGERLTQVAEYQGKLAPEMFAGMLSSTGGEYGDALLVVENATMGHTVLSKLKESEYPNLYWSVKSTHEYVDQLQAEYMSGVVPGFTTSLKTRPIIIAKLDEFLRNDIIKVNSTRLIHEMQRFIWNNGRPEAQRGGNDDLTISLAIACWVRDTALHKSARDVAYSKAMLNAIVQSNTRISTAIPGMIGYNKKLDFDNNHMKEIKEEHKMYSWLYKG